MMVPVVIVCGLIMPENLSTAVMVFGMGAGSVYRTGTDEVLTGLC